MAGLERDGDSRSRVRSTLERDEKSPDLGGVAVMGSCWAAELRACFSRRCGSPAELSWAMFGVPLVLVHDSPLHISFPRA